MIASCMKRQVVSVGLDTTAEEAARLVMSHHIGTLPVVDEQGLLVGVVRLQDLLQVFMPDFVALLDNIDLFPNEPRADCPGRVAGRACRATHRIST